MGQPWELSIIRVVRGLLVGGRAAPGLVVGLRVLEKLPRARGRVFEEARVGHG